LSNTYASLRVQKVRKGRWVYACELCGVEDGGPDLFRAIEIQQRHEKTLAHSFGGIVAAFRGLAEAFQNPPTQSDFGRES
jgi:hypothetical protein